MQGNPDEVIPIKYNDFKHNDVFILVRKKDLSKPLKV